MGCISCFLEGAPRVHTGRVLLNWSPDPWGVFHPAGPHLLFGIWGIPKGEYQRGSSIFHGGCAWVLICARPLILKWPCVKSSRGRSQIIHKFWEANMNWMYSHLFKANINQLIFNQGCHTENWTNQSHYFVDQCCIFFCYNSYYIFFFFVFFFDQK